METDYSKVNCIKDKLILRYNSKDMDGRYRAGNLIIIVFKGEDSGFHELEYADVVSASPKVKKTLKGDIAITSYLVNYDEQIDEKENKNKFYLDKDEDGNFYRFIGTDNGSFINDLLIATTDKDCNIIYPKQGWVFCEKPISDIPEKIGMIYMPDMVRKVDSDKKPYKTKVHFINELDKQEYGIKEGDLIMCEKNTDIEVKILDKTYIRVPATRILGKLHGHNKTTRVQHSTAGAAKGRKGNPKLQSA